LKVLQLGATRATLHIADPERNVHAQKTKRGDEEGNSDAEKEVGWSESRKKERASHR
jgi:hypothetical protein